MKIEKRGSGYRVQPMIDGKRYSITFGSRPSQADIAKAIANLRQKENGTMTFYEACLAYIDARSNTCSPKTIKEFLGYSERFSEALKRKPIDNVTQNDVQKEVNLLSARLAPKTVKNYYGVISSVLGSFCPDLRLSVNLPKQPYKAPYVPRTEDVDKLLAVAKNTPYEVPILLGLCSMRRGEICALTEDDIDFENGIIRITKDMVLDKDNKWVIKQPKTVQSIRNLKVPDMVMDAIKRNGLYKGHPGNISDWMSRQEKKYGIPHFSLHKTRHYFASKSHDAGVSDADIMNTAGWATPNVMIKHYRGAMHDSSKAINAVLKDF